MLEKPAPKVLTQAGEKVQTTNLSIKKIMNPSTEGENVSGMSFSDMPREAFSIDQVNMFWRQFANKIKQEGKETFYNAMIKRNPKMVSETHIVLEVDNAVQVDLINSSLESLISFLRSNLKNYDVNVEVKMTENVQEDVKHLTGKDKFAILARKYPNLHALKTTFNLDIEY